MKTDYDIKDLGEISEKQRAYFDEKLPILNNPNANQDERKRIQTYFHVIRNGHYYKERPIKKAKTGSLSVKKEIKEKVFAGDQNKIATNARFGGLILQNIGKVEGYVTLPDYICNSEGHFVPLSELSLICQMCNFSLDKVTAITRDKKVYEQNKTLISIKQPINFLGEWEEGVKEAILSGKNKNNVFNADSCESAETISTAFYKTIQLLNTLEHPVLFRVLTIFSGRGINSAGKSAKEIFLHKEPKLKKLMDLYGWETLDIENPKYKSGGFVMEENIFFKP